MASRSEVLSWRGQDALDADGDKIGSIEEIYLDAESNEPEWALVNTGLFGTKRSFVPLREASPSDGEGIRIPYDKATVKDAPKVDPDGTLSQQEEAQLYRHYGLDYSGLRSETGDGEGRSGAGGNLTGDATAGERRHEPADDATAGQRRHEPADDATAGQRRDEPAGTAGGDRGDEAMTRSEEELAVGTAERETGRARLKKYVVEDEVTETVPVRREEIRVEREPITDANRDAALSGPDISEAEHEVVLHEEEAVAEKRTVPKERIRLEKDVHQDEREVADTVRRERIDVDDPADQS